MAQKRLLIAASPGERRLALVAGGRLLAYTIERPSRPPRVGALAHARVTAVAPALAGAFLAIAPGESAFLPAEEAEPDRRAGAPAAPIGRSVHVGQAIAVRITRAAMGGKGARATARLSPAEIATATRVAPPAIAAPGEDAATRFLAQAPEAIATDDPDVALSLAARFPAIAGRITVSAAALFDDALEEQIEALAEPAVPLPRGGRLRIALTAAVTAIDVDTGASGGGNARAERAAANRAAIAEAARQVALRELSGAIVLDLAGLPGGRGARSGLVAEAERAFAEAVPEARVLGLSRLGFVEIVRPRVHPPLAELLGAPAEGVVLSAETQALAAFRAALRLAACPGASPVLVAAADVVAAAEALPEALAAYAQRAGRPLALAVERGLPPGAWRVEDARRR